MLIFIYPHIYVKSVQMSLKIISRLYQTHIVSVNYLAGQTRMFSSGHQDKSETTNYSRRKMHKIRNCLNECDIIADKRFSKNILVGWAIIGLFSLTYNSYDLIIR